MMENRENILSELNEIAPGLLNIGREMPFAVPEGYFDIFPVSVLGQLAPKQNTMSVPEGYFESLPDILLAKAKASAPASAEIEEDFPLLNSISKQMPYNIPASYFENLEIAPPKQEAKVIPISRGGIRKMAGWAVAASILALVSIFGWRYFSGTSTSTGSGQVVANQETSVQDSISRAELASALAQVEDKNLDAELDNYGLTVDESALYYLNTVNFEKALETISDEELSKSVEEQALVGKKS